MAGSQGSSNPYGLSDQDFSDLQQIRSAMKPDDPRGAKIDTLLATRPQETQAAPAQAPQATIQASPTGVLPWLRNLESDIRYGSNSTGPGRFLHKIGMQPTTAGVAPGAEQMIASPINGPIHTAQGVAELPKQPWQGTKDIVGGALETAQIPGAFMAPEGAEAASRAPGFLRNLLPNAERAGQNFQTVAGAAKKFGYPVNVTDELSGALSKYQQLVDAGGSRSVSVSKLLNRVTNPDKGPLSYEEARDFYSNISRLSADESNRLTPVIKRQVGAIRQALNNSIQRTATLSGAGPEYGNAMNEYRQAMKLGEFTDMLKGEAGKTAIQGVKAAGAGAAGVAGYKAYKSLTK